MAERYEAVVIGGGQAGLSISYYLTQQGRDHVVLEQGRPGEAWRSGRWDSFTLVVPNWSLLLPGFHYAGSDPDGFLPREQIIKYLDDYVASFNPPLRTGVTATSVERDERTGRYLVSTDGGRREASIVVVATGLFQKPGIPALARDLPSHIVQVHTSRYRNPDALPLGAVLVVGSSQSGAQIAEDLQESGRKVYLSLGSAGRVPRRYRGKDIAYWLSIMRGDRTVDKLPHPRAKFAPSAHLSGSKGGHTISLHKFARDGMTLLGHLSGASGSKLTFAPDMHAMLTRADEFDQNTRKDIDNHVLATGMKTAPPEDDELFSLTDGFKQEQLAELDLERAGITSVVWATGYSFDFSWVKLPVFDEDGFPIQRRGVTEYPGLYFLGLPWLHNVASGIFAGVGDDAAHLAADMEARFPAKQ